MIRGSLAVMKKCIAKRRYKADKKDFKHIKKYVDYVVNNELRDAYDTARLCKELDEIERRKNRKNLLWKS